MRVRDLMNPHVHACGPETTVLEVAKLMKREDVGLVPILEGGRIMGVVTDRDLALEAVTADALHVPIRNLVHHGPVCVDPDASLEEAADQMIRHRVRRLCVSSQPANGTLQGIVSLDDLASLPDPSLAARVLCELHPRLRKSRKAA
ncbi:MAG: CBS domain-containing protein [Candidatus Sericytochromatia bacterium]|nr:CBS domain-containing protein [Candidatus Sericytochromatia bacterium]